MNSRSIRLNLILTLAVALAISNDGTRVDAQEPKDGADITVGPNVQVSKLRDTTEHAEVVIAADPTNASRLLAGSIIRPHCEDQSVIAYRSFDGGGKWELAFEKEASKGKATFGDPAIAYGPDGSAYFAAMGPTAHGLELVASRDGGKTWEPPTRVEGEGLDRPFLAVDCGKEKFRGRVYCSCSLFEFPDGTFPAIYVSRDGAKTLDPPRSLEVKNRRGVGGGQGAVLSDGALVLPYRVTIRKDRSAEDRKAIPKYDKFAIRIIRSNVGAQSYFEEQSVQIADYIVGRGGYPMMPILAVDPGSHAFKDRLYLVWSQMIEDAKHSKRVMFALSKDKGVTWTKPTVLSEMVMPKDVENGEIHHADLPSVAVNRDGVVGVTWHEFRSGREGKSSCDVRFVASLDGGTTWLPSVCVTDAASKFEFKMDKRNWVGDTMGLAADARGTFHPLWVDDRTGIRQIFTATVAVRKAKGGR